MSTTVTLAAFAAIIFSGAAISPLTAAHTILARVIRSTYIVVSRAA